MKYIFSIIFVVILFLPLINSATHFFEFERKDENRTFHDSLSIDINHLDRFPEDAKNYLNDNFVFRSPLLAMNSFISIELFHESPSPEMLIIGKDKWYFLADEEVQIYKGKRNFTADELKNYEVEWSRRSNYLDSLNIKYTWVICPSKLYVYEEFLPSNIRKADESRVDILSKILNKTHPNLIYNPIADLKKEASKGKEVYFRNDNHWNYRAGAVIANGIIERMKPYFPNQITESSYRWKDTLKEGGYLSDLLNSDQLKEQIPIPKFNKERGLRVENIGFEIPEGFVYPDQFEMHFVQSPKKNNLKILVIRDSFGDATIPFIKESFGESVFIFDDWHYLLNEQIIEQFKPDIVVFLGLETHMRNFIKQ